MLDIYRQQIKERADQNIPPKPLDMKQAEGLVKLLLQPSSEDKDLLVSLLENRIPPGVDEAAKVKAEFLDKVARGELASPLASRERAVFLLGTMAGGYNIRPLVNLLDDSALGDLAADALSKSLLVLDVFSEILEKSKTNPRARKVIEAWANALWFTDRSDLAAKITVTVFKVTGEVNTDDLSPAGEAWSRPDIPLHALSMLKTKDPEGIKTIAELKKKGYPVAFCADVLGTGSSRKSATNSVLWHTGDDIPFVPNKRQGGICIGGKIAPIFFNTMEDAGALPIECDVTKLETGAVVDIYPYLGKITKTGTDEVVANFSLKTDVLLDEAKAGGRIPLIIGRTLTKKAREALGLPETDLFRSLSASEVKNCGFTLAQKMIGKACGKNGVRPGEYCEPVMTTVGSQDTTGPMTRDELKELACLEFSAGLVMQSFCHTAAYPKKVDITMHETLPEFITSRKGVALRPGDGIIHSWLNRMILPDTVGTGGDSHTRFPIGISFPAGSGLVAFAAAMGVMPLDVPESVLVRFKGKMQPGITLRDLVNAIPLKAIEKGLLTVEKAGKKNVFSGRILEIEGLPDLKVEQAFELSDASAERSAAACTVRLNKESVIEFIKSNIVILEWMTNNGYGHKETLKKRISEMKAWLDAPVLLEPDADAEYAETIEIDLDQIKEPILACPNDPDDVKTLSAVAGAKIDEVFIGSCMTNIGHFRASAKIFEGKSELPVRLWMAPPTFMDQRQLMDEGLYSVYAKVGARMEIPGCSLCMGNQARIAKATTAIATSTRNFPDRIGDGSNVYLGSAELSAVTAVLGKIPTKAEYLEMTTCLEKDSDKIYSYLQFDQMEKYM
ncbi:bifunctional aconitate hydratase 2/2-methylisocitrate dehydratase [Desulforegula conservatrix]|uniref:bifunctional aconitate hydratase 2/2-methylisocitrate dehydratase n=1 Tax=Desulforegula conservatrix TaxID=153026 RepID=UPI0003F5C26C|nr:bifunctional aconitate hydratase 2/2-methylisocitrate dehydratase [Desulforegula conservatrix]